MAKRKRNYRAEYARRIELAKQRGYSVSVARGHPPDNVIGIRLAAKLKVKPGTSVDDIEVKTVPDDKRLDPELLKESLAKQGLTERQIERIDVMDQETFIRMMLGHGFTFREAFDLYFGY